MQVVSFAGQYRSHSDMECNQQHNPPSRFRITRTRIQSIEPSSSATLTPPIDMTQEGLLTRVIVRLFKSFEQDCMDSPYFRFMLSEELKKWSRHLSVKDDKLHVSFQAEQAIKARLAPALGLVLTGKEARQESDQIKCQTLQLLEQRRNAMSTEMTGRIS